MKAKPVNLSHSSITTYRSCPRKFKLDKIDKIRPAYYNSPFFFGSLIDGAIETYLEDGNRNPDLLETLKEFELNGKKYNTFENIQLIKFSAADLQLELLDDDTIDYIKSRLDVEIDDIAEFIGYYKSCKGNVSDTDKKLYNLLSFYSLIEKGKLITAEIFDWIDENVAEVVSTQQYIEIENEHGDKLRGYLDFIVKLKDGRTVLIDLKTSSDPKRHYPENCVEESQQLGIYAQEVGLSEAAYLVVDKKIRKRVPRVRLHYIEGEITEEFLDEVFEEIDEVLQDIKAKKFPMNKDSCFQYGRCQYYDYCHHYKSMKGLVNLKKDEEK